MTDQATWKAAYNLFIPTEKLEGERLKFFVEREGSITREIAESLAMSDQDQKMLVVGQTGSGKSTEIRYLASLLEDRFFNVVIDIEDLTDVFTINHVELLYVIGLSLYAAANHRGFNIKKSVLEELTSCLETLVQEQTDNKGFKLDLETILSTLTTTAAVATGGTAGMAMVAVAPLFKGMKLGLGVDSKQIRKIEVKPKIGKISEALNKLIKAVEAATQKKPFVIVDGLDRIEVSQAKLIFTESQILTLPQCMLAYVVPVQLYHSPHMSLARQRFPLDIQIPNIKLHPKDHDTAYEPGYDTLRHMVRERLKWVHLKMEDLFEADALDELISKSGGLTREFIRLVRDAIGKASFEKANKVTFVHVEEIVARMSRNYQAGITVDIMRALKAVQRTGMVATNEMSDILFQNLYVLTQSNKKLWYEVHPMIAEYVNNFDVTKLEG